MGIPEVFRLRRLAKYEPVPGTGCWIFSGSWDVRGYGRFNTRVKNSRAHRFFYEELVGPIPSGLMVCHKCDTPPCVNPDHMFLGTNADNMADMTRKGRRNCAGERNGRAVLTEAAVVEIRQSAESTSVLAKRFGVSAKSLQDARSGRSWASIKAQP